jgi:hypothetical protein
MGKRWVIIQAAGLGFDFLRQHHGSSWQGFDFQPLAPVFPALTCTAQASFRTALPPSGHGMIANGLFHRDLRRPLLWEQSSALVSGPRIWETFRSRGKRVALLFWQQSLGESVDMILSPAPVHKHGGGMVQSVYSQPQPLYRELCGKMGRAFKLHRYWGPLPRRSWTTPPGRRISASPISLRWTTTCNATAPRIRPPSGRSPPCWNRSR